MTNMGEILQGMTMRNGHNDGIELSWGTKTGDWIFVSKKPKVAISANELTLVGEVHLNQDRVSHIVPSVPGIVTSVHKALGDVVDQGETLAVLRSVELAEAKSDYFEAYNEVGCCLIDLKASTGGYRQHRETSAISKGFAVAIGY